MGRIDMNNALKEYFAGEALLKTLGEKLN